MDEIFENSVVESGVKLGKNVKIMPFCYVGGQTELGDGTVVESFSFLLNAKVGANVVVRSSRITDSAVGDFSTVGPNAHLRQNAVVGKNCRIGNFVEVKGSVIGDGCKASHLAYIGDAEIGANCNVGCGVIFVNYDGKDKHKTVVGNNCFIGCNSNLVAPLEIGDDCFVACGATVDKNLPVGSFSIGRSRISIKENYAEKYLKK